MKQGQGILVCVLRVVKLLSRVQLFAAPWTVAYQVPPSMGFSRQEYWNCQYCKNTGLPFPKASRRKT